jgi:hypothetical protein
MTTSDWIAIAGIAIGLFATTIGSSLLLAFKMGALYQGLHQEVKSMAKTLERIPLIELTIARIMGRLDVLWEVHMARSNSPIVLNEIGLRALETSNIGAFAETIYPEILRQVKDAKPENAYQAQKALVAAMQNYGDVEQYKLKLQEAAFVSGHDVNSLLFVAALSIRDRVVSDLGF